MVVSEDHTSCWVRCDKLEDLTVTKKKIQTLLTAAMASDGRKDIGWKGRMSITSDSDQAEILNGHRNR